MPLPRHESIGTPRSFSAPHRDVPITNEARRKKIAMTTLKLLGLLISAILVLHVDARTIVEIEKEIRELHNEYVNLQKTPIFVWGSKQQNLSEKQKCATSAYNINIAQGKERNQYKTKRVVTLNPEYICSIHKAIYVSDHCPVAPGCKTETRIGTGNFCNLGPEYDLSYKTWKALKEKIPEGEAQEARLKEIEKKIADLRAEQTEIKKQQSPNKIKNAKTATNKAPSDATANSKSDNKDK